MIPKMWYITKNNSKHSLQRQKAAGGQWSLSAVGQCCNFPTCHPDISAQEDKQCTMHPPWGGERGEGYISASSLKTGCSFFSASWKTIEGQEATKIHWARMLFTVAEKDFSWYLYYFMGVKPHSVQIRSSKAQVLHTITKVGAIKPDGSMLLKDFMGTYFTYHLSKWTLCVQAWRKQPRPAHILTQRIVRGSLYIYIYMYIFFSSAHFLSMSSLRLAC